jgi:hypothetical protein
MTLSVEETLIYFGYIYGPNLTHQGASVITKILSAALHTNGYRNKAMPNNYYFTCNTKIHFQEAKTIQLGKN